jgi:hypothetical protein
MGRMLELISSELGQQETKFTSPCLDQGQSLNQWIVAPHRQRRYIGHMNQSLLLPEIQQLNRGSNPLWRYRQDTPLSVTLPSSSRLFFLYIGTASGLSMTAGPTVCISSPFVMGLLLKIFNESLCLSPC